MLDCTFGRYLDSSHERLSLTFDYESGTIRAFRDAAERLGSTAVIDIGANIGVYSIYAGSLPEVEVVHALEPAPAAFEEMSRNFALQTFAAKLRAHPLAASDAPGKLPFRIVSPMSGTNAIASPDATNARVEAVAVDDLLAATFEGAALSIKIDVEGHEAAALRGMERLLRRNDCYLQVECLDRSGAGEIENFLSGLGFAYVFSIRNDYIFVNGRHRNRCAEIAHIIAAHLSHDLKDLLEFRRRMRNAPRWQKRLRLWESLGYKVDPLLLPEGEQPF